MRVCRQVSQGWAGPRFCPERPTRPVSEMGMVSEWLPDLSRMGSLPLITKINSLSCQSDPPGIGGGRLLRSPGTLSNE